MSLQAAYACFIGRGGLTVERYTVYAGLKRGGYTVIRAPTWDETVESAAEPPTTDEGSDTKSAAEELAVSSGLQGLFSRVFSFTYNTNNRDAANTATGPVVGMGIHRSYSQFFPIFFFPCFAFRIRLTTLQRQMIFSAPSP